MANIHHSVRVEDPEGNLIYVPATSKEAAQTLAIEIGSALINYAASPPGLPWHGFNVTTESYLK